MKKYFVIVLCLLLVVLSGCSDASGINKDSRVDSALSELKSAWTEEYEGSEFEDLKMELEIINTRVVNIKDDADDIFADMDYVVEFVLYSYVDGSEYSTIVQSNNCVCVYNDGTVKVSKSPFEMYMNKNYSLDVSDLIESIDNFQGAYNQKLTIK